jgi:hypothetical protein
MKWLKCKQESEKDEGSYINLERMDRIHYYKQVQPGNGIFCYACANMSDGNHYLIAKEECDDLEVFRTLIEHVLGDIVELRLNRPTSPKKP